MGKGGRSESIYEVFAVGTRVEYIGRETLEMLANGLERGRSGIVIGHNPIEGDDGAVGKTICVRFNTWMKSGASTLVMNVSPRDITPI